MTGPVGPMTRRDAADLLDVDRAASPADVQRAFLRAARRVHPDVLPDADEAERRTAAADFDRLLRARDLLMTPVPPVAVRADAPAAPPLPRAPGRGLGGSLVVLALLAFLLVLLVTVEQGLGIGPFTPDPPPPTVSSVAP